jgi:hypothetical protein
MDSAIRKMLAIDRVGSVKDVLSKFNPKVTQNEGSHDYITKTIDSPTPKPYFGKQTEIHIPFTDHNINVVEFTKSFFTLLLQIEVYFPQGPPFFTSYIQEQLVRKNPEWATVLANDRDWFEDPKLVALAKAKFFFIGFKSAGDCIHQYKVVYNGRDVRDTLTQKAQIESYIFNATNPKCG